MPALKLDAGSKLEKSIGNESLSVVFKDDMHYVNYAETLLFNKRISQVW